MRDFHKTHLSGSRTVTKTAPSAAKIKLSVTSEGTGVKPGVPDVTEEESSENSDQKNDSDDDKTQSDNENESNFEHVTDENESGSESDQDKNEEDEDDEEEVKDELVKTPSNDSDDEDETKFTDKAEGFVQEDGTDAAMTNVQQGNENPKILQVIEDAHVTLSTVPQKTEVPVSSSSYSSVLAAKFLNFSDIPTTEAEIVSPMDVHVYHEVPSKVTALEQEVAELKKDPLYTQVTALVDKHLDAKLGATRDEFMNFLLASLTTRIKKQVKDQQP
ncbi:hypothetical protein Tco_1007553 [Tanacetum coccineum]